MPRFQSLAAMILMVAGIATIVAGRLSGPPHVDITWNPALSDAERATTERSLGLRDAHRQDDGTWEYVLVDLSRPHLDAITHHPDVYDWAGVSHERERAVTPRAPPVQAWLQVRYETAFARWLIAWGWLAGPALCGAAVVLARRPLRRITASTDPRIVTLLVLATALRVWLIVNGGQFYWPDERQYRDARRDVAAIIAGEPDGISHLFQAPSALVLKLFGAVPAAIEKMVGQNPRIPSFFFGSCSIVSIWLIVLIARRLDGTRDEVYLAALLATGSTVLLYMSRHLLNYDLALMFGLGTVLIGVSRRGPVASLLTGVGVLATFLAYAGAWTLAGAAAAIHVADARTLKEATRRAFVVSASALATVLAFITGYRLAGLSWVGSLVQFASTVRQGEFDEGWRLPFEYLWHAEHLLFVSWLLALAYCSWRPAWAVRTRLSRAGLIGATVIYAGLAMSSTVLRQFVVYGRLSRPLVPFLCLVTAAVIGAALRNETTAARRRIVIVAGVTLLLAGQAALNFRTPLTQEFPPEFIARVEHRFPPPRLFVNAKHLYPGPEPVTIPPGYREVASSAHPLEYLPYQYEGFAEGERRRLRSSDLTMRAFVGPW